MCPPRMKEKTKRKDRFKQMCSEQRTADTPSPFARPGSRAGTSTTPASEAGVQPVPSNPFARPNSRAGFVPPKSTSPHSSSSSPMSSHQFQEDVNTSFNWDLIDTDTDTEVANINNQHTKLLLTKTVQIQVMNRKTIQLA